MKFMSILIIALLLTTLPASAQYFTKNRAEHDSLAKVFAEKMKVLMQKDPELAQTIIIGFQISGDNIITKGHQTEFVSMPGKFKKQVVKTLNGRIDDLNIVVLDQGGKLYSEIHQLESNVNSLSVRVSLLESKTTANKK